MDDVERTTDVDLLWSLLREAREAGDRDREAAIRARMAALQEQRRFDGLSDEELAERIRSLQASTRTTPIKYTGMIEDTVLHRHVRELNLQMVDGARHDASDHLADLLAEQRRRRGGSRPADET